MNKRPLFSTLVLILLCATAFHSKAILIDELVDGDFSNLPASPSPYLLDSGDNFFSGTTVAGDPDLISVTIDIELVALSLVSYSSVDNLGFIGLQTGSLWTEGLGGAINPANLLGWSHFGPGNGTVGSNILDNIGAGAGATGFTGSLGPGTYTFLIQQTGGAPIDYQFNFTTASVPEPSLTLMTGIVLLLISIRKRQHYKGVQAQQPWT